MSLFIIRKKDFQKVFRFSKYLGKIVLNLPFCIFYNFVNFETKKICKEILSLRFCVF